MKFVFQRLVDLLPALIGVSLILFLLIKLAPVDPAILMLGQEAGEEELSQLRQTLGLDQPLPVQCLEWLGDVLHGDLGNSYKYGNSVAGELAARFPATLMLATAGILVTVFLGIPLGVLAATKQGTWVDTLVLVVSLSGVSMPVFLIGFLLIWFLSFQLPLFPTAGMGGPQNLVLPALAVGLPSTSVIIRLTRTSMLEVLRMDYMRTAHAKGLRNYVVLAQHGLKNAMIPVVTIIGLQFGHLLGGSIIAEQVFAWPGVGSLIVSAVQIGDYPVTLGAALLLTLTYVVVNLLVDLSYGALDPRLRFGGEKT